ncbi:hypothetical protein [Streptomyces gardneri]|uniref:Uncharacterized protein n=1 Tax=Streptomyces gardneri TaxID=66892 RepID=A0A4Y3RWK1_9ACTN|nr:hypothetical protein [Streptomyces gardneri]GEB61103.1 hypothetical protein SGA01_67080 [Streptomyces gardneri]GHG83904.1 hypothetical protein GCM10017674_06830 [Streptomyces gardneri]
MATLIGTMILAIGLPAWAGITYVGLVRARRGDALPEPQLPRARRTPVRKAAWTAGLAYLAGGALHLYGLSYLPFLQPEDACWFNAGAMVVPDSSSALPVSLVCHGEEVVPPWVNPGLLVLAVTAVGATVTSIVLALRRPAAQDGAGGQVQGE